MSPRINEYEAFKDLVENKVPFNKHLGIKLLALEKGMCKLFLPFSQQLVGDSRRGAVHGGVISSLIDTCGGFAVWAASGLEDRISTIDMRVDYLKPILGCSMVAESRIKLLGNRVGNVHTTVFSEDDPARLLAEGRAVYNIRKPRENS